MSTSEVAAVVVAAAAAFATLVLLAAVLSVRRALGAVESAVAELQRETVPLVTDLQVAVRRANDGLGRVDGLLDTAESISTTVDSASRLAYLTFSNPVIKALAFASGTSRAFRRLRRRED